MRRFLFSLLAVATSGCGVAHAAGPSATAQNRAVLYRREVRSVLAGNGWRIVQNDAGHLAAERRMIPNGTAGIISSDTTFAHLDIRFRADNASHTACSATAARYIREFPESSRVDRLMYPPLALRDPKLTQEYHATLVEADRRLMGARLTSTAAKAHSSEAGSQSVRVVLN